MSLFPVKNALHPLGDAGQDFIRNGAEFLSHVNYGRAFAKNCHRIAFLAFDFGRIDHEHVHANASENGRLSMIDGHKPYAVAPMARDAIGVTDWNRSDFRRLIGHKSSAITDRIAGRNRAQLRNDRF